VLPAACNCGPPGPGAEPVEGLLLGAQPVPGPDDAGVAATEFVAWAGALDGEGGFTLPEPAGITATCEVPGPCMPSSGGVKRPGTARGLLAIVLDDSGSNGASPNICVGCPTDPDEKRVEAIRVLLRRVYGRAPAWRIALFDFGWNANGGRIAATLLAGYTSYEADFDAALDAITPGYSTYIFDSIVDVVPTLAGERAALADAGTPDVPARILVVSDGEDTSSVKTLAEALALAKLHGVAIDTVGYGQRGDAGTVVLANRAYRDLRRLAVETGGFCTVVSSSELPALFARVGELYVAGWSERRFTVPEGGAQVRGRIAIGDGTGSDFFFEDFR